MLWTQRSSIETFFQRSAISRKNLSISAISLLSESDKIVFWARERQEILTYASIAFVLLDHGLHVDESFGKLLENVVFRNKIAVLF
jgi:hypothetical protein